METKGLDDILNAPEDTPEPITDPKTELHEASPVVDRPRDEHGRFLPKDDTGEPQEPQAPAAETGAPPAPPEDPTVPRRALEDERRKRQAIESRLQMLEQSFQRQPGQAEPPPDFFEDPKGFLDRQFKEFGSTLLQEFEQRQTVTRANASERVAASKYPDYYEVRDEFMRAAEQNPALAQEMFAAENPAEFAYQRGKATRELSKVGSLDDLKAQIRAEIEAEIRASAPSITAPMTTAGQRSVGARSGPEWQGPAPLSDILASKPPG